VHYTLKPEVQRPLDDDLYAALLDLANDAMAMALHDGIIEDGNWRCRFKPV
jgi:hypothetical protein